MLHFLNTRFEELLGSFLLAVMACIAFINIIIRYCTNLSFSASEELTVNFFVWIVLLGTSIAFRESSNFTMNLLYSITHGWFRKTLYFFGVLCSLAFFAMLVYLGAIEVIDEIELNVSSESLDIPLQSFLNLILDFKVLVRIIADLSVLVIFILKFCFLDFRLEDSCNLIGVHLYVF